MKSLPNTQIKLLSSVIVPKDGFLKIQRSLVEFTYEDQSKSEMTIDSIIRKRMDAVNFSCHYLDEKTQTRHLFLRSSVRPSLAIHEFDESLQKEISPGHSWGLPAGLIEEGETVAQAAQREALEELGLTVDLSLVKNLGRRVFASASAAERVFFVEIEVNPANRIKPSEDGSPMEKGGLVEIVPLKVAFEMINNGEISSIFSETAIRRLISKYGC